MFLKMWQLRHRSKYRLCIPAFHMQERWIDTLSAFPIFPIFIPMSLTPPKRLFNITTLSTVMYNDVADDVEKYGYVAISHVWGNQNMYNPEALGITGVDWNVPLSSFGKFLRLKNAMICFRKKYCWWDILCMPQDKQDEINLEIPFMGDYYSGADVTFVLSDKRWIMSRRFLTWCCKLYNAMKTESLEEDREYIKNNGSELKDIAKDQWFERVWTFQEAILSKEIILIGSNGGCLNLSLVGEIVNWMTHEDLYNLRSIGHKGLRIMHLHSRSSLYKAGGWSLVDLLRIISYRSCRKECDIFYGTFGVLGYKDFSVDYNIDMDDLNRKIAQYAYSKGDISWISIGGDIGISFVQPMYKGLEFVHEWKIITQFRDWFTVENNTLHMMMLHLGTVSDCEKCIVPNADKTMESMRWAASAPKKWGYSTYEILLVMTEYPSVERELIHVMTGCLELFANGMSLEDILTYTSPKYLKSIFPKIPDRYDVSVVSKDISDMFVLMASNTLKYSPGYAVSIKEPSSGKKRLLMASGSVDIGDKVVIPMLENGHEMFLGIVTSSGRRKGVCIVSKEYTHRTYPLPIWYEFRL